MGHVRLGTLPRTRKWQQVTALLASDAGLEEIAAASSDAAEKALDRAANDPAFAHAFWLLTQIPLAARHKDYLDQLWTLGLTIKGVPTLWELVGAFSDAVDDHARSRGGRTDLGEMAQLAAAESLTALASEELPSLFGATAKDAQAALRRLGSRRRFSQLAEEFFARLARRHLAYYLSRELSNHVGPGRRLESTEAHSGFNAALDQHCRETARIIRKFSEDWFSKAEFEGGITPEKAKAFAHIAFRKLQAELRKRRDADA